MREIGFPGLIAPASLKRKPGVAERQVSSGFPGLIAPASLKPPFSGAGDPPLCNVFRG